PLSPQPSPWPRLAGLAVGVAALLAAPAGAADELEKKDREMTALLAKVRLARPFGHDGGLWTAKAYRVAFRDHGIDLDALEPAEAAERVRKSAARAELVAALDDWAGAADAKERDRLHDVANRADPDPLRGKVREALAKGDRKALAALAAEVK